jgi:hypothetical protein
MEYEQELVKCIHHHDSLIRNALFVHCVLSRILRRILRFQSYLTACKQNVAIDEMPKKFFQFYYFIMVFSVRVALLSASVFVNTLALDVNDLAGIPLVENKVQDVEYRLYDTMYAVKLAEGLKRVRLSVYVGPCHAVAEGRPLRRPDQMELEGDARFVFGGGYYTQQYTVTENIDGSPILSKAEEFPSDECTLIKLKEVWPALQVKGSDFSSLQG